MLVDLQLIMISPYRQKQELQRHVFSAHSDEVIKCKYEGCDATANCHQAMVRHVNKVHKPEKYR